MTRRSMAALVLALVLAPAAAWPEGAQAIDRLARELAAADRFSGGVLIQRGNGEVLLREAYGHASREFGVPNTPDTRYSLGSINKSFTAVAVLQLVEQGEADLDDTVIEHLPGVLPDSVASRVTVRHLLTHTSGLGDFLFTPEMERANRAAYRTIQDYLPMLADDTLAFEPGSDWGYSNTGFLVLGALLEAVTGVDYETHVRAHVLKPAGMADTGWPELDRVPGNLASAYTPVSDDPADGFVSDRYDQVVRGTPAGGGFSTLDDLARFGRALLDGRLLQPETVDLMLSPKPELGSDKYGFGVQLFWDGWVGHTGGGPGTADFFAFHVETGDVIVVLANQLGETMAVVDAARTLLERL